MADDTDDAELLLSNGVQFKAPNKNQLAEAGSIGTANPQEKGLREAREILEAGGSLKMLTAKQMTMVQAMADGASPSEAYRFAYDQMHAKPSEVSSRAAGILRLPHVAYELYRVRMRQEERLLKDRGQAQRFVVEHLQRIVEMPGTHHSARVAALSLLGKYSGLFGGVKEERKTGGQVEEELMAKLRVLLGDSSVKIIDESSVSDNGPQVGKEADKG